MESYRFLLDLAVILLATKVLGILAKKVDMPQVVGALAAGLILGPVGLGLVAESAFLDETAELGVIILMFTAGLETDIQELKKSGGAAFIIALLGVLLPLGGGAAVCLLFQRDAGLLQAVFLGVVLTATSVSITVETLREMGRLSTKSGSAILGAALIDDILGIIALTVIIGAGEGSVSLAPVLGRIAAFFICVVVLGLVSHRLFLFWAKKEGRNRKRFAVIAFAFCLFWAFGAEALFGVADITGAYMAGLVLSSSSRTPYIVNKFETCAYMIFSPVFFVSIGCKVVRPELSAAFLLFTLTLTLVAVATKAAGCGLGAKLCRFSNRDALRVGVGMVSRGEVALIVASKGLAAGLLAERLFSPIIITVVITTIATPILLRAVYGKKQADYTELVPSRLAEEYEDLTAFDEATQAIVDLQDPLGKKDRPAAP